MFSFPEQYDGTQRVWYIAWVAWVAWMRWFVGGMGQILAWVPCVALVHKTLARFKQNDVGRNFGVGYMGLYV